MDAYQEMQVRNAQWRAGMRAPARRGLYVNSIKEASPYTDCCKNVKAEAQKFREITKK